MIAICDIMTVCVVGKSVRCHMICPTLQGWLIRHVSFHPVTAYRQHFYVHLPSFVNEIEVIRPNLRHRFISDVEDRTVTPSPNILHRELVNVMDSRTVIELDVAHLASYLFDRQITSRELG
jgi:hypothetical protein